jgi:hypothetical protein
MLILRAPARKWPDSFDYDNLLELLGGGMDTTGMEFVDQMKMSGLEKQGNLAGMVLEFQKSLELETADALEDVEPTSQQIVSDW